MFNKIILWTNNAVFKLIKFAVPVIKVLLNRTKNNRAFPWFLFCIVLLCLFSINYVLLKLILNTILFSINLHEIVFSLIIFGFSAYLLAIIFFQQLSFLKLTLDCIIYWALLAIFSFLTIISSGFSSIIEDPSTSKNMLTTFYFDQRWVADTRISLLTSNDVIYFIFTISIIALFANYHASIYMSIDQKKERFIILLNGFAFSMVLLVFSRNLWTIFLSWELLGITSFFLINHNETQADSESSAFKAFVFNRISDVFFITAICLLKNLTENTNLDSTTIVNLCADQAQKNIFMVYKINFLLVLIFLAAITKSVQVFTFMWLPDSMKAPAPASALIHSATLVAAGFYLILILKPLYFTYWGTTFMVIIGMVTATLGAVIAIYQYDVKKILAFSTIANCGFMLTLIALYDQRVFLIYFVLHGIFKSVCFIFAGETIILQQHNQDTRFFYKIQASQYINLNMLALTLALLAGVPHTITYTIKHYFHTPLLSEYNWYIVDMFFTSYSALSMVYAFSLFTRIHFVNSTIKTDAKEMGFKNEDLFYFYYTALTYAVSTMLIAFVLRYFFVNTALLNSNLLSVTSSKILITLGESFIVISFLLTVAFIIDVFGAKNDTNTIITRSWKYAACQVIPLLLKATMFIFTWFLSLFK